MGKLQNRTQEHRHHDMNIQVQTMSNNIKFNQNNINFLHDVSLRSVSNSKFWMPSRTLLSLSSLRDIRQRNEPQTTKRITPKQNCVYWLCLLCQSVYLPPFKLTLDVCAQPYRPFWKQQVNLELTRINYSLVATTDELKCLWHSAQGYTRRYSRVPCIWTYPNGENAAVPVAGSWRAVGETHRMRPVVSSSTWQGGDLTSFTSRAKG